MTDHRGTLLAVSFGLLVVVVFSLLFAVSAGLFLGSGPGYVGVEDAPSGTGSDVVGVDAAAPNESVGPGDAAPADRTWISDYVFRTVDEEAGVVCYVVNLQGGVGIDCLPLDQTNLVGRNLTAGDANRTAVAASATSANATANTTSD
ncbi:MAG: hypothetical protein ABEJ22_03260 [Haloferacaceae archaeon]